MSKSKVNLYYKERMPVIVRKETGKRLNLMKAEKNMKSHDELINYLIDQEEKR